MTTIRRFRPDDAAATHEIFREAVHVGAAERYSPAERAEWAPETEMPDDWGDWLDAQTTLVAEEDGQLTGFMMVEVDGYLNMAFVRPEKMRTGLADRLYHALLAEVRALGLTRLNVHASRYAQGFFRRHGWQPAPEFTERDDYDPNQGPGENPSSRPMKLDPVPPE